MHAELGLHEKAAEFQEKVNTLQTDLENRRKGEERLRHCMYRKPYRQTD